MQRQKNKDNLTEQMMGKSEFELNYAVCGKFKIYKVISNKLSFERLMKICGEKGGMSNYDG